MPSVVRPLPSPSYGVPPGVTATATDSFASVVGNQIVWDIGRIPPQNQLDIFATLTARAPFHEVRIGGLKGSREGA